MSEVLPRSPEAHEVEFYRKHGWVHLPHLVTRQAAARMQEHAQGLMGADAQTVKSNKPNRSDMQRAMWQDYDQASLADPVLEDYVHGEALGRVAYELVGRPVRYLQDQLLVKRPSASGGAATKWHQDMPYLPLDRSGVAHIWLALVDIPPEMGSMRFLDGSHLMGFFGRAQHDELGDLTHTHPELFETCSMSPPLQLAAGDATVHDAATAHYAPPNSTDAPRWAYLTAFFRADALYTGAPHRDTSAVSGLQVNKVLDHPRFPLAYPLGGTANSRGLSRSPR